MSLPGAVKALGLGDIRVDSALNEPLSAQIDIVGATRDELAALTAGVANRDIFQRYGADRPSFLSTATFKVGMDAQGRPVLNVRSADAFTDPLVSFLVDIRWGKNEIVREYSLLLDPPNYRYPRPVSDVAVASAAPAAPVVASPAADRPPTAARPLTAARSPTIARPQTAEPAPADLGLLRVTVAAGDTLRGVARRAGARSETQAQALMIAIFHANPNAFDGNINRMHRGAVLTIPTWTEVAAISSADARREVRAHMTAWRLDGRAGPAPRVASAAGGSATTLAAPTSPPAPAAAPAAAAPMVAEGEARDASLKSRVQSLEQQLEDMHKQLANENAKIQALKQATQSEQAAPLAAPTVAASSTPPATTPALASTASPAMAPVAAGSVPPMSPQVASRAAELVSTPIVPSAHPNTALPVDTGAAKTPTSNAEIFGPVAVTLGLLVAGFAYIRRRLVHSPQPGGASTAAMPAPLPVAAPEPQPVHEPMSPIEAFKPVIKAAAEPPRRAEFINADTAEQSMPLASSVTTSNLEIDIEALERSYLESLPAEPGSTVEDDPALADTTTVETVAVDTQDLDTAFIDADLNTVLMDVKELDASPRNAPVNSTALDFNLVDLDATAQHVHMPSGLNDHAVMAERRTNIVDVLKMAIERDPNRRDLRMKLLETYYSVASANQRAFMDVVRKLSREKELLTPDDWKKVTVMGREIAADDILFADLDPPKDGEDLAHCA